MNRINWKGIRTLAVAMLLIAALCVVAMPVQAKQDLKITSHNLYALQHWGTWIPYSYGELLRWEYGPVILDARYQKLRWVGNIPVITTADHEGYHWGECVSLAKALSKSTVTTGSWSIGNKVMTSNVAPGTVIATFGSGGYYGHTAIFRGHTYSGGQRTGILVWDQNYVSPRVVGRHSIRAKGTTWPTDPTNANNYCVVRVP